MTKRHGPREPVELDTTPSVHHDDGDRGRSEVVRRINGRRPFGSSAILAAFQGGERMIYALRLPEGLIKIGCSSNVAQRRSTLGGDLLGFKFGDFDEELEIHHALRPHVARGREYYSPTPAVLAVVNEFREPFNLEPLDAENWRAA